MCELVDGGTVMPFIGDFGALGGGASTGCHDPLFWEPLL
jgi:hypothetical protein